MRILRRAGKRNELTLVIDHLYHWNILGLWEIRWKSFGEIFSGEEDRHEYGVGFLVHKDMVSAVLGCRPASSRLISIRLRSATFNVTIMKVYEPTSGHDDNDIGNFYQPFPEMIDQTYERHSGCEMGLECLNRQAGETYVDPTAMLRQIREVSDS